MPRHLASVLTVAVAGALSSPALAAPPPAKRVSGATPGALVPPAFTAELQASVLAASVFLPERACTGVVLGSPRVVATAAHCIPDKASETEVRFSDGTTAMARVEFKNDARDLALLVTPEPSSITPLRVTASLPKLTQPLLFLGRPDRARAQHATVARLAPCPSLPKLPAAAYTTLSALPGDSGAPLVDARGRVVALVHGGARCEIAVPAYALRAPLLALSPDILRAKPAAAPAAQPPPPAPPEERGEPLIKTEHFGPIVFERTAKGFRFQFSFSVSTDD